MRAKRRIGLHLHAEGAAELVEVVHVERRHGARERVEHVLHRHAERDGLLPIDLDSELRHRRAVEGVDAGELRVLRERGHELLCRLVEPCRIRIAASLQVDLEAARRADAADRRRIESERQAVAQAAALLHDVARDELGGVGAALVPFLERHEHGGGIALVAAADQIEADDADGVLHAAVRGNDLHHVVGHLARALERRAVGELQRGEDVARALQAARPVLPQVMRTEIAALLAVIGLVRDRHGRDADRV